MVTRPRDKKGEIERIRNEEEIKTFAEMDKRVEREAKSIL